MKLKETPWVLKIQKKKKKSTSEKVPPQSNPNDKKGIGTQG